MENTKSTIFGQTNPARYWNKKKLLQLTLNTLSSNGSHQVLALGLLPQVKIILVMFCWSKVNFPNISCYFCRPWKRNFSEGIFQEFKMFDFIDLCIYQSDSVVYTGFRGWGVPGAMGGVLFYIGEIENLVFFHTRKISKNFKKSMKIKILKKFWRKFGKNLENLVNMHL